MVRSDTRLLRALTLGVAAALMLAACSGTTPSGQQSGAPGPGGSGAAQAGGTIYLLSSADEWNQVDPQRAYTGEDLAFFGATIYRSLVAYTFSPDDKAASVLVPDLATDLGTPNADATAWSFTLRDGVTWQDGKPITCEDVKYGTSRTFATSVINQGPTYAIAYLDIPTVKGFAKKADGTVGEASSSAYGGPYSPNLDIFSDKAATKPIVNDTAAYDKAVTCDGNTITFNLNAAHGDFNYTTTLGFSPVPKAADTGETYGVAKPPVSSGPYQVESYTTGNGGKMVLVRNPNWSQASDPYRTAYPDKWEVDFGLDPKVIDQRLIQSSGSDQTAIEYGGIQPENLAVVFSDPSTPTAQFKGRAVSGQDIYALYYWINVQKVPNVKIRQAMAVALDRSALRKNAGGDFYGTIADGVIKPNIGPDYAESGMWTDMFGKAIPDTGDPELAKKLIAESGKPAPKLIFNFADTPTNQKSAAIVIASLGKAGITVTPAPLERGKYYSVVFDPAKAGDFGTGGWGADWPNASTVIAPLLTQEGGWDLSQVDDAAFNKKVEAAQTELDRTKQEALWQALNKEAMLNVYVIPTFFELTQRLAGTKIASPSVYIWGPYGSWPYGAMYVLP
jgi:ABC-type dipeptide transport system, periplasmic component